MKPCVAQLVSHFLPLTQTFIYGYLRNLKNYEPLVITEKVQNLEKFPFDNLYVVKRTNTAERALDRMTSMLYGKKHITESRYNGALAHKNVKLIHGHFGWSAGTVMTLRKSLGLPAVTTFYGADLSALARQKEWLERYQRLFRETEMCLVEGNHMKECLIKLGCPEHKVTVQHIGVDIEGIEFKPRHYPQDGKIIVLMCGSFMEKKGTEYGIEAFAKALREVENMRLVIAGDGQLRPEIERQIDKLDVRESISMLGYIDFARYLKAADEAHIFMAPSVTAEDGDTEGGAPTVLLEMQAGGLPVLSTYHADIPEVVIHEQSGFLVPERDSDALAERLVFLARNPALWESMGENGRRHIAENYDISIEARNLEAKYDKLILAA